jgi:hypothetical protein
MEKIETRKKIFIFLLGFFSCAFLGYVLIYGEVFFITGLAIENSHKDSPSDWIKDENITISGNSIIVEIGNFTLSNYADTGSMEPTINNFSKGISIKPKTPEDIQIGDIVSYFKKNKIIVHRVIEKGRDEFGDYFITKGDNNANPDKKIYFKEIKSVIIGVLY